MRTSVSRRMGAPLGWRSNTASLPSLHHAHRGQSVDCGPVAEFAVAIVAPAIGGTRSRDPAGVEGATAHRGEAQAACHGYWARPIDRRPVAGRAGRGSRSGRLCLRSSTRIRHGRGARAIKREATEPEMLRTAQMGPARTRVGDRRFGEASERRRQSEGARAGMATGPSAKHRQCYRLVLYATTDRAPARRSMVSIVNCRRRGRIPENFLRSSHLQNSRHGGCQDEFRSCIEATVHPNNLRKIE